MLLSQVVLPVTTKALLIRTSVKESLLSLRARVAASRARVVVLQERATTQSGLIRRVADRVVISLGLTSVRQSFLR